MTNKPRILVPTDFTPIGDSAVNYAEKLAEIIDASVDLLHIIGNDKDNTNASLALNAQAEGLKLKNIRTKAIVEQGNIYDDIGRVAHNEQADFIIMGTHGDKGLQKILGSKALKVITNSEVPFIVVQKKPMAPHGFKNIVMPLSMDQEIKQTLYVAIGIAKYFSSKVHILYAKETDVFFKAKIERNLPAAVEILEEQGLEYELVGVDKRNLAKNLIQYADSNGADLIAFLNNHENFATYVGGSFEQTLIANDKEIPVMVVNSIKNQTATLMGLMYR